MRKLFFGGTHPAAHKETTRRKPSAAQAQASAEVQLPLKESIANSTVIQSPLSAGSIRPVYGGAGALSRRAFRIPTGKIKPLLRDICPGLCYNL